MISRRQFLAGFSLPVFAAARLSKTAVSIAADQFLINGVLTYPGRVYNGSMIEGLLLNSRMVQGIFDDANPETRPRWKYPDTGVWDPERNTAEFIAAMPEWRRRGLLAFTINLQGGSPEGYSKDQPWDNSTFRSDGSLKREYLDRLERILDRADDLGMVPIVGYFYFGQASRLSNESTVRRAARNATQWLHSRGYRHVVIEIANECDMPGYRHAILKPNRIHELMDMVRDIHSGGRHFLVGTSFSGGKVPPPNVVAASDFLLLHGNGVGDPARIAEMVRQSRRVPGYRTMPILFNEDDHFDFEKPTNNMLAAISEKASWGYFDQDYQRVPVDWQINTPRKRAFFDLLQRLTSGTWHSL